MLKRMTVKKISIATILLFICFKPLFIIVCPRAIPNKLLPVKGSVNKPIAILVNEGNKFPIFLYSILFLYFLLFLIIYTKIFLQTTTKKILKIAFKIKCFSEFLRFILI